MWESVVCRRYRRRVDGKRRGYVVVGAGLRKRRGSPQQYYGELRLPAAHPDELRFLAPRLPLARASGDSRASQVPGGPSCTCPALSPRWGLHVRPSRRVGIAFRHSDGVGPHDVVRFVAEPRGPCTPCVRFTSWVTPCGATLGSGCWPSLAGRESYPQGPSAKFQVYLHTILLARALPGAPLFEL